MLRTCDFDMSAHALPSLLHGCHEGHLSTSVCHKANPSHRLVEFHPDPGPLTSQPAQVSGRQSVAGCEAVVGLTTGHQGSGVHLEIQEPIGAEGHDAVTSIHSWTDAAHDTKSCWGEGG